jgi:hypothetical protein
MWNDSRAAHESDLSPSLTVHPISKIAHEKRGNGKSCDVDTQRGERVGGVSIVFPHAFRIVGGKRGNKQ